MVPAVVKSSFNRSTHLVEGVRIVDRVIAKIRESGEFPEEYEEEIIHSMPSMIIETVPTDTVSVM